MTFATPTIISGDKSNIGVIAHEIAHSWAGNLVTNATWQDFWLNEGWTRYIERRMIGKIYGDEMFHFSAILGWKALRESVDHYGAGHEFTKLVLDLEGKDPDDAFSSVPYEKGFNFLFLLDKTVGRKKWDKFIPYVSRLYLLPDPLFFSWAKKIEQYFTKYREKSLSSADFQNTLFDFFESDTEASKALSSVDWESWYHSPGLPNPEPAFDTTLAEPCYALAKAWESLRPLLPTTGPTGSSFTPSRKDIENWSSTQIVVFLEKLTDLSTPLTPQLVQLMDGMYKLSNRQNAEVLSRFFTVGLQAKDVEVCGKVADWLGKVGRMKFVRPLYRLLDGVNRTLAVSTFKKNIKFYHPICRDSVRKDLRLEDTLQD